MKEADILSGSFVSLPLRLGDIQRNLFDNFIFEGRQGPPKCSTLIFKID